MKCSLLVGQLCYHHNDPSSLLKARLMGVVSQAESITSRMNIALLYLMSMPYGDAAGCPQGMSHEMG